MSNERKPISIDDIPDADLARMVRESVYAKGTRFGDGITDARFLLVFAVPYGPEDFPDKNSSVPECTLPEALDAFARLLQDDDWMERSIQVYEHGAECPIYAATAEELDHYVR